MVRFRYFQKNKAVFGVAWKHPCTDWVKLNTQVFSMPQQITDKFHPHRSTFGRTVVKSCCWPTIENSHAYGAQHSISELIYRLPINIFLSTFIFRSIFAIWHWAWFFTLFMSITPAPRYILQHTTIIHLTIIIIIKNHSRKATSPV